MSRTDTSTENTGIYKSKIKVKENKERKEYIHKEDFYILLNIPVFIKIQNYKYTLYFCLFFLVCHYQPNTTYFNQEY